MSDLDRFGQQPFQLRKQRREMGHDQMRIEIGLRSPIFVENKATRVGWIDMEVVVDAAGLGPRRGNLGGEQPEKLVARFGSCRDCANDRHMRHDITASG